MNTIAKNIAFLSTGQIFRVILRLVAFSVIAKSLSISQYGQFITIIAFCELFQIFTLPGMSKTLERSACRDLNKVDHILSSKSGLRNLIAIIAILLTNIAVYFMGYDSLVTTLIRYYSIVLFLDNMRTYIRIVFKVFEEFKWITVSEVVLSITYLFLVLVSIHYEYGVFGIIFASILSNLMGLLVDFINSKRYSQFKLFGGFEIDKTFLISAWVFTLTNMMWLIITKIDIIMLSKMTTSDEVAMYGVANRIIFFGVMGISVVSNVIYPPIVKTFKKAQYIELRPYIKQMLTIFLIFLAGCLTVFLNSDLLISLIAGKKYVLSSQILNILIIYIIIQAISTPIKLVLYALDKEKLLLLLILPLPIIKIVLNLLYFNLFGITGIAYSTVIVYATYLLLLIIVNRNLLIKLLNKPI
jgi:O-antigen/teichoic acid export membrane protein